MSRLIVVTGAAGFIGRNVVAELNQRGMTDLLLVDRLETSEKWRNLRGLRFEDLISPQQYLQHLTGSSWETEAIIHLGACSATTERDADYLLENNYRYTRTLCQWSLENHARFVYASSAATYGDGAQGYSDDDGVTPSLVPLNMYGYSKHLFDLWALKHQLFDRIVGLKYFNVYGPYEDHKADMRSVVHKAYHQIQQSGEITLFRSYKPEYADGQQKRDFIYVKDAVDATLHFASQRKGGGLFNIGTGQARTWIDLAKALFKAMDRQPNIRFIDMPETLRGKYQYFTQAKTDKLRSAGYTKPFTTLEDGIRDYVQSYLMHQPD
ncbi:MAG: ADP-glyceromanno-heptose 6-epimerase [Phycisphaerales bacterium]|nr:ADP-glyceromanno-heptose 6-epimerase [Phycisphaerales bacterium]